MNRNELDEAICNWAKRRDREGAASVTLKDLSNDIKEVLEIKTEFGIIPGNPYYTSDSLEIEKSGNGYDYSRLNGARRLLHGVEPVVNADLARKLIEELQDAMAELASLRAERKLLALWCRDHGKISNADAAAIFKADAEGAPQQRIDDLIIQAMIRYSNCGEY